MKVLGQDLSKQLSVTFEPIDSWLAKNFCQTLSLNNGILNAVVAVQIHKPIHRFTFSGRKITLLAPAGLMDTLTSQTVKSSAAITRFSRVQFKVIFFKTSLTNDIFSLLAIVTQSAFCIWCALHDLMLLLVIFSG